MMNKELINNEIMNNELMNKINDLSIKISKESPYSYDQILNLIADLLQLKFTIEEIEKLYDKHGIIFLVDYFKANKIIIRG